MTYVSFDWMTITNEHYTRRTFSNLGCGKNGQHMKHAFCACRIMRVWLKSSWTCIVLAGEMSSSHISPCVASHIAGIGSLSFSLSLSSFSVSFYAYSPVALVNIFFALAVAKRNELLYMRCAARERSARMVAYGHARSLTHSRGPITCHTSCISRVATGETREKKETSPLLSSKTNFRQRGTLQNFCSTPTRRLTNRAI